MKAKPLNESYEQLSGRLKVIQKLCKKFSLSVGSKETRFADVNIDIDPSFNPDIVADARFLPFRNNAFQQVLFTDVIEHLPKGDESKALQEIYRVLCRSGELILTTPHDISLFTLLDPAFYVMRHRHYKVSEVQSLLKTAGFRVNSLFTSGGLWTCINTLWYCFITYPLRRILGFFLPYAPKKLRFLENEEYKKSHQKGYTIFVKARKAF